MVDTLYNAYVFPSSDDVYSLLKSKAKSIFINIADRVTGEVKGYVLNAESKQLKLQEVWNIKLATSEHIIDQTGKRKKM